MGPHGWKFLACWGIGVAGGVVGLLQLGSGIPGLDPYGALASFGVGGLAIGMVTGNPRKERKSGGGTRTNTSARFRDDLPFLPQALFNLSMVLVIVGGIGFLLALTNLFASYASTLETALGIGGTALVVAVGVGLYVTNSWVENAPGPD